MKAFKEAIKSYLDKRANEDPLFAESYKKESKNLDGCVNYILSEVQNEYYKKKDSLILSAKVDGVRKETIEVSLKTFSVVQSRAAFNKNSEYHNRIVELVNRNMNVIRRCV